MKKFLLISLMLLAINTDTPSMDMEVSELSDIAGYITSKKMTVDSWQVTVKEQVDRKKLERVIKDLEQEYSLTVSEDENSLKYSFHNTHKRESIVEYYNVIIPKNERQNSELVGVLKGGSWDSSVKDSYQLRLEKMIEKLFTKSANKFACLTTGEDGIMGSDYFIRDFVKSFNVQQIDTQFDTVKNSMHKKLIYGYIPLWNNKITIVDKPVNLQIAVIESETGDPIYTIGTPILINEY
ncbi:hypothetical protein CIL03_12370 [Virgibacillus indicus]|uniref:TATA-box binding n=1 Tax=Virgibacillus indicus TaxID=2024554 RepID=A0A265N9F2_9BACI|nr:YwmB family TATA-box binding protein [Virgibacillus indicus]OZU88435.1 hypothetical protein CIL03_12370 [Virgibacillus indicus]